MHTGVTLSSGVNAQHIADSPLHARTTTPRQKDWITVAACHISNTRGDRAGAGCDLAKGAPPTWRAMESTWMGDKRCTPGLNLSQCNNSTPIAP